SPILTIENETPIIRNAEDVFTRDIAANFFEVSYHSIELRTYICGRVRDICNCSKISHLSVWLYSILALESFFLWIIDNIENLNQFRSAIEIERSIQPY